MKTWGPAGPKIFSESQALQHNNDMIYIRKQQGLYQNKFNSSHVSTCYCKMGYNMAIMWSPQKFLGW